MFEHDCLDTCFGCLICLCFVVLYLHLFSTVTLQALSSTPTNPHSCFAWSYKALAMLVDCMWSFGWRLEGEGEDSHKACSLFELAIVFFLTHRAITC